MRKTAKHNPLGHHTVTPHLFIKNASRAIEFYKKAFSAVEVMRLEDSEGKIMHAEIQIGDSPIVITDEHPEMNLLSPESLGGTSVSMHLHVDDADSLFEQATAAGATVVRPVQDRFYGYRCGSLTDAFGHLWHIAMHKENVEPEELRIRTDVLSNS